MLRRHTRLSLPHSLHFLTTATNARGNWFQSASLCEDVLSCFEQCRRELQMLCVAYVLMPDHFHALVLQEPDIDVAGQVRTPAAADLRPVQTCAPSSNKYALPVAELMRRFKRRTSVCCLPVDYPDTVTLWHRRYDDVGIENEHIMWTKIRYIHNNPVKKGLAETPKDYPWSSANTFLTGEQRIVRVAMNLLGPYIR